ncbi:MAG: trypsin-like peptidase domain-containing protein [Planctomycetaceae bacterium]|nr:trypsin-like peptidase domain-containing protein [Planctomycetaceae bacterium]
MNLIAMLMLAAAPVQEQAPPDVLLLDFYASYCQPCRDMVPVLQRMAKDQYPIRKVDIEHQPELSRRFKVTRIPTLIILVEGREAKRFTGLTSEDQLRAAMNDARQQLQARRADQRRDAVVREPRPEPADVASAAASAEEEPGGFRGLIDRMKRGLGGQTPSSDPDYRGQSPELNALSTADAAMESTVRVRLIDGNMRDFGTGTIVHSDKGQSTILTCAHIFKGVSGKAAVVVDVFRDGEVLKYPATVVGGDHNSDVAFLTIQNASPLPTSPIAQQLVLRPNDPVFSIGCNNGDLPTRLNMNVVEINRYEGPENVVCTLDPVQGRSGGGLFNTSGELVGVCSGAFRKEKQGLYSGVQPVLQLADRSGLDYLIKRPTESFSQPAADSLIAADPTNPFAEDDAMLEEMMAEATPGFTDFDNSAAPSFGGLGNADPAVPTAGPADTTVGGLPDPFATAALPSIATTQPTEVTVIIDSKDPAKGKRVIVIPRPSPWLLELLTGEPNSGQPSGRRAVTATSARHTVRPTPRPSRQLSRPVYHFQVR